MHFGVSVTRDMISASQSAQQMDLCGGSRYALFNALPIAAICEMALAMVITSSAPWHYIPRPIPRFLSLLADASLIKGAFTIIKKWASSKPGRLIRRQSVDRTNLLLEIFGV